MVFKNTCPASAFAQRHTSRQPKSPLGFATRISCLLDRHFKQLSHAANLHAWGQSIQRRSHWPGAAQPKRVVLTNESGWPASLCAIDVRFKKATALSSVQQNKSPADKHRWDSNTESPSHGGSCCAAFAWCAILQKQLRGGFQKSTLSCAKTHKLTSIGNPWDSNTGSLVY